MMCCLIKYKEVNVLVLLLVAVDKFVKQRLAILMLCFCVITSSCSCGYFGSVLELGWLACGASDGAGVPYYILETSYEQ